MGISAEGAKSPEPLPLQNIQPPWLILPSLLGQEKPAFTESFTVFAPSFCFKWSLSELYGFIIIPPLI